MEYALSTVLLSQVWPGGRLALGKVHPVMVTTSSSNSGMYCVMVTTLVTHLYVCTPWHKHCEFHQCSLHRGHLPTSFGFLESLQKTPLPSVKTNRWIIPYRLSPLQVSSILSLCSLMQDWIKCTTHHSVQRQIAQLKWPIRTSSIHS